MFRKQKGEGMSAFVNYVLQNVCANPVRQHVFYLLKNLLYYIYV